MNVEELVVSFADNTADETNFKDLGILKFLKHFFPDIYPDDFSLMHYNMAVQFLRMYDPRRKRRIERQNYFIVHREGSKTTTGNFGFVTFAIYMKGIDLYATGKLLGYDDDDPDYNKIVTLPFSEGYILILSETGSLAEQFVTNIKSTIETRLNLIEIFGDKHPQYVNTDEDRRTDTKWTKSAFITSDNTAVMGLGSGMQVRGRNIRGQRPTLCIIDDMYSEENTKTEHRREKINQWFFNALLNSLDSHRGKALWLGTIVHPDTVASRIQKNSFWSGIKVPIISMEELDIALTYVKDNGWFETMNTTEVKNEIKLFEKGLKTLSWRERHNLHYILSMYQEKVEAGNLSYFYQEYMNEPLPPEEAMINEDSLYQNKTIKIWLENGVQNIEFMFNNVVWSGRLKLEIGIDPASSEVKKSDDTVIVVCGWAKCYPKVAGIDWENTYGRERDGIDFPVIAHVEGGKYAIYEYNNMPGIAERTLALCYKYDIARVKIETNAQQGQIYREVNRTLKNDGITVPVWQDYNNTNKAERIGSEIFPIIQKYGNIQCVPNKHISTLYYQLLFIGYTDKDDYADATAIAYKENKPIRSGEAQNNLNVYESRAKRMQKKFGNKAWYYS